MHLKFVRDLDASHKQQMYSQCQSIGRSQLRQTSAYKQHATGSLSCSDAHTSKISCKSAEDLAKQSGSKGSNNGLGSAYISQSRTSLGAKHLDHAAS